MIVALCGPTSKQWQAIVPVVRVDRKVPWCHARRLRLPGFPVFSPWMSSVMTDHIWSWSKGMVRILIIFGDDIVQAMTRAAQQLLRFFLPSARLGIDPKGSYWCGPSQNEMHKNWMSNEMLTCEVQLIWNAALPLSFNVSLKLTFFIWFILRWRDAFSGKLKTLKLPILRFFQRNERTDWFGWLLHGEGTGNPYEIFQHIQNSAQGNQEEVAHEAQSPTCKWCTILMASLVQLWDWSSRGTDGKDDMPSHILWSIPQSQVLLHLVHPPVEWYATFL